MHKRNINASQSENTPIQFVNTKSVSPGNKKSQTMFPTLLLDRVMFAAVAGLLLVSAIAVATSDNLQYLSDDMNMHAKEQQAILRASVGYGDHHARKGAPMKRMMAHSMAPPHIENLEEMDGSVGGVEANGSDTIGKMLLDALQSQKQTNTATTTSRMLIMEGGLQGKVPGSVLDNTAEEIASLAEEGGYVASRSSTENEYHSYTRQGEGKHKVQRFINLHLRIPSSQFQSATQRIKQIIEDTSPGASESPDHKGRVTSLSTNGRDVTDEFVDTTARADTLDASRKAIQVLLSQANAIDDVIKIQTELNELTQQSESLRRRALDLKNKSELSTLNVSLEEWREADAIDDADDNYGKLSWSPLKSASLAWTHISFAMMFAFDTLAYSLVWAIPCVGIYLAGVILSSKLS